MRELSEHMIKVYKMNKLLYDFMGYTFKQQDELSFHHLVLPRCYSEILKYDTGYFMWNGVLLVRKTAHDYLHVIERADPEVFYAITYQMIQENISGQIDLETLKKIRDILLYFEKEHIDDVNKKGDCLIKPEYIEKRISLK